MQKYVLVTSHFTSLFIIIIIKWYLIKNRDIFVSSRNMKIQLHNFIQYSYIFEYMMKLMKMLIIYIFMISTVLHVIYSNLSKMIFRMKKKVNFYLLYISIIRNFISKYLWDPCYSSPQKCFMKYPLFIINLYKIAVKISIF